MIIFISKNFLNTFVFFSITKCQKTSGLFPVSMFCHTAICTTSHFLCLIKGTKWISSLIWISECCEHWRGREIHHSSKCLSGLRATWNTGRPASQGQSTACFISTHLTDHKQNTLINTCTGTSKSLKHKNPHVRISLRLGSMQMSH